MNIKLKKKFLYFNNYKVKCALGKRGITYKKIEGDNKTPAGTYKFRTIFYRKDRVPKIKSNIKKIVIKKNMGWCDDPDSKFYNKLIKFPFNNRAEKLWLDKNIYDIIIIIDYNMTPIVKNKGSAIFLHISTKRYTPTRGCIAVSKKDMHFIISKISNKTNIEIN
jgi:L,D-peptidoglycan transpeptidase YkuD (ErfK/YbiS/YcfS/YnhG family)|tara:strand:- start:2098 stop:2589 length:492 start_codon:yes stop_codon:yes gene_type:complete